MPAAINQVVPVAKPMRRHDEIAERIITTEGLTFSFACVAGKAGDLRQAREYLKAAICRALAGELAHGAELQRRSMESNAMMDRIEEDMARETPNAS